jgi:hypothetical protein
MHLRTLIVVLAAAMSLGADPQPVASTRDVANVFTSLYAVYDTAGITERYRAEHGAIPRANTPAELARALFKDDTAARFLVDGWGTPLHIESDPGKGYLIVAAGADGKFDRTQWSQRAATTTAADDVVFRDGELIRSPVAWVTGYVANAPGLAESRERLLEASRYAKTVSSLRALASSIATYEALENKRIPVRDMEALRGALEPKFATSVPVVDGWGHPFVITADASGRSYVIASAGPDGRFDRENWNNPSQIIDDIVLHADGNIRNAEAPPKKSDAAAGDTDRLLDAYAGYMSALQRFNAAHR